VCDKPLFEGKWNKNSETRIVKWITWPERRLK
jgi:hypothetical protein